MKPFGIAAALAACAAILLYAGVAVIFGAAPVWTSTTRACTQPSNVDYGDGARYGLFVRKPTVALSLSRPPSTAVVSRYDGSYADAIELHDASDADEVDCVWTHDGIEIREPNGVAHTVPATVFRGGR